MTTAVIPLIVQIQSWNRWCGWWDKPHARTPPAHQLILTRMNNKLNKTSLSKVNVKLLIFETPTCYRTCMQLFCVSWNCGYMLCSIGATTVWTGGDWSPTVRSPKFFAIVFKKHKISQQVLYTNERRSHQNAGFSIWVCKNFPGWYPRPPQWELGRPHPALTPTRPGRARGCWDPNLGPSTFQPWLRPCYAEPLSFNVNFLILRINFTIPLFMKTAL